MGIKKNIVIRNNYKDSVFLMQIAGELEKETSLSYISLFMGTAPNKDILRNSRMLTTDGENAGTNDLIIAVEAEDKEEIDSVLMEIQQRFKAPQENCSAGTFSYSTLESAMRAIKDPNFVLISVPGDHAAREAHKALDNNLNVMIFSDNISVKDEVSLKNKAVEKDLLLMGPDCGTAVINGVPLGFANAVSRGCIGISAASGSGLQEVLVTLKKNQAGITQAFGTGGRDLSIEVGGTTMNMTMDFLYKDPSTRVVILISKPPHPDIAKKLLATASRSTKPTVICFLGSDEHKSRDNLYFVDTLEAAAIAAAQISRDEPVTIPEFTNDSIEALAEKTRGLIPPEQKYVRGLYSGGTLCHEAAFIMKKSGMQIFSNIAKDKDLLLKDPGKTTKNTLIDMGADEFTVGRPHPMIDLTLRNKRMLEEASCHDVAMILFDVILGYGSNNDPAGSMEEVLGQINNKIMVASICGTEHDPQDYARQVSILKSNGVILFDTNAQAARFAAKIIG